MDNTLLNILIDRNLCIGAAACIAAAPEFFQLDEDNVAETKVANPILANSEAAKRIREAADSCPTGAITVSTTSR